MHHSKRKYSRTPWNCDQLIMLFMFVLWTNLNNTSDILLFLFYHHMLQIIDFFNVPRLFLRRLATQLESSWNFFFFLRFLFMFHQIIIKIYAFQSYKHIDWTVIDMNLKNLGKCVLLQFECISLCFNWGLFLMSFIFSLVFLYFLKYTSHSISRHFIVF